MYHKMYFILAENVQNRFRAPDPLGSLRRSPDRLVVRGFLPSAIAASCPQLSQLLSPKSYTAYRFTPLGLSKPQTTC